MTQRSVQQIEVDLAQLTKQLNEFRPISEKNVGDVKKEVFAQFEQRLTLQSSRIDEISESVNKSQKTAEGNSEMLQNLLIGIENMGDNLKNIQRKWTTGVIQKSRKRKRSMLK